VRFGLFLNTSELPALHDHGEILESAIAYAEAAERLCFYDAWISEHHFIPFGICSSALTMAGFLLGRTRRLRLGTAVTLVHLYHPVQLAEQAALLDQLSGGRLDFGVGRGGYLQEVEVFGVNRARHGLEVEATLDVLLDAWTKQEVASDNPLFPFAAASVNPRPRTQPHPPLFIASATPATVDRAAREGLPLLLYWGMTDEQRVQVLAMYREAAERHDRNPDAVEHVLSAIAYVADDAAEAQRLIGENLIWSFRAGNHPHVPSFSHRDPAEGNRDAFALSLVEGAAVGTPELCIERLAVTLERTGAHRMTLLVEAAADRARTLENIERLAAEVLPAVAHHVGASDSPAAVAAPADD